MGLDMYLHARCYISTYNDENKAQLDAINAAIPGRGVQAPRQRHALRKSGPEPVRLKAS